MSRIWGNLTCNWKLRSKRGGGEIIRGDLERGRGGGIPVLTQIFSTYLKKNKTALQGNSWINFQGINNFIPLDTKYFKTYFLRKNNKIIFNYAYKTIFSCYEFPSYKQKYLQLFLIKILFYCFTLFRSLK